MRVALVIIFVGLAQLAFGQQSERKKKDKDNPTSLEPSSKDPHSSSQRKDYAPKKQRKSKGGSYNPEKEFAERMALVAKAKEKEAKEMEKPQYSDPMYFGHKHPPKKHKPGKMKYCKECGIRH